jgi:hypothetical protein
MSGPIVVPNELNACDKFNLLGAVRSGPRMVTYGLQAICNIANPIPTTNSAARNSGYDVAWAAGKKSALPTAAINKPIITPFLYPIRLIGSPDTIEITKYIAEPMPYAPKKANCTSIACR